MSSIQWTDTTVITDNPSYGISTNQKLLDIKDFFGLTQIVKEKTRQNNVLDICFVKSPDLYHDTNIIQGISDRGAVAFAINQQAIVNYDLAGKSHMIWRENLDWSLDKLSAQLRIYHDFDEGISITFGIYIIHKLVCITCRYQFG